MVSEPRTVTVTGWLAGHQVRRHLEVFSIPHSEERRRRDSMFTVEATPEQWDGIQQAKKQAEGTP